MPNIKILRKSLEDGPSENLSSFWSVHFYLMKKSAKVLHKPSSTVDIRNMAPHFWRLRVRITHIKAILPRMRN
jgi:hypothetical protein